MWPVSLKCSEACPLWLVHWGLQQSRWHVTSVKPVCDMFLASQRGIATSNEMLQSLLQNMPVYMLKNYISLLTQTQSNLWLLQLQMDSGEGRNDRPPLCQGCNYLVPYQAKRVTNVPCPLVFRHWKPRECGFRDCCPYANKRERRNMSAPD